MAMLLDFVPEAVAFGAILGSGHPAGPLLALLIAMQNLPEGFNAYTELMAEGGHKPRRILFSFLALVPLGPVAAYVGHMTLTQHHAAVGELMLFAAAGIVYLIFQDIAPQSQVDRHWAPALGAVAGFATALLGKLLIG